MRRHRRINPTRRGEELAADIRATDCQVLITESVLAPLIADLDLGFDHENVLLSDDVAYLQRFEKLGTPGRGHRIAPRADDLFLLIFTSGSTGGPKAVRMTQGRAARSASRVFFTPDDVLYCAMPLFHGNALSAAVFPAFASGATLALRRKFSASHFLSDVQNTRATFFNTVGRAIAHIVATLPAERDRDHRLRFGLSPETSVRDKETFTKRFGVPLIRGIRLERKRHYSHAGGRRPTWRPGSSQRPRRHCRGRSRYL